MRLKPCVIILEGHPCTGKSVLLRKLSDELKVSFAARDEFKELLFDELGIQDSEWSKKLGRASYALLFCVFEKLLKTGQTFILENNFDQKLHRLPIKALLVS